MKKCKVCNVEKEQSEFFFHSTTGHYMRTCKSCHNEKRRKERQEILGTLPGNSKRCKTCNEVKLRNEENFDILSNGIKGKLYSKSCKECRTKFKISDNRERRCSGKDETRIKKCNLCGEEKHLSNFYFQYKINTFSYCCKDCDKKRIKERKIKQQEENPELYKIKKKEIYNRNTTSYLYNSYKNFDLDRNYEFNLTKEYIKESLDKPCSYCEQKTTGLDRIDNTKGHTIENTIPCCRECNTVRMNNFSVEEMKIIGQTIKQIKLKRNET